MELRSKARYGSAECTVFFKVVEEEIDEEEFRAHLADLNLNERSKAYSSTFEAVRPQRKV